MTLGIDVLAVVLVLVFLGIKQSNLDNFTRCLQSSILLNGKRRGVWLLAKIVVQAKLNYGLLRIILLPIDGAHLIVQPTQWGSLQSGVVLLFCRLAWDC